MSNVLMSDIADATAEVLVDVDSLLDWAYSECRHSFATKWPRVDAATAEDFRHVTVANLVSLLFDAGQPAIVTQAARDALSERYVADADTQARIKDVAQRIANEREEDERQDRAEHHQQFLRIMDLSAATMPIGSEA